MKEKALDLMQMICLTHDLDHLSSEEIEKTIEHIFEKESERLGLDVKIEQLKKWIAEDRLKEYFILEDKEASIDRIASFNKFHETKNTLRITSKELSRSNLKDIPEKVVCKIKILNNKL